MSCSKPLSSIIFLTYPSWSAERREEVFAWVDKHVSSVPYDQAWVKGIAKADLQVLTASNSYCLYQASSRGGGYNLRRFGWVRNSVRTIKQKQLQGLNNHFHFIFNSFLSNVFLEQLSLIPKTFKVTFSQPPPSSLIKVRIWKKAEENKQFKRQTNMWWS